MFLFIFANLYIILYFILHLYTFVTAMYRLSTPNLILSKLIIYVILTYIIIYTIYSLNIIYATIIFLLGLFIPLYVIFVETISLIITSIICLFPLSLIPNITFKLRHFIMLSFFIKISLILFYFPLLYSVASPFILFIIICLIILFLFILFTVFHLIRYCQLFKVILCCSSSLAIFDLPQLIFII